MNISHKIVNGKLYLYVDIEFNEEFAEEFLNKEERKSLLNSLKEYVKTKLSGEDIAVLIINGVLIGSLSMGLLMKNKVESKYSPKSTTQIEASYIKEKQPKQDEKILANNKIELYSNVDSMKESILASSSKSSNTNTVTKPAGNNSSAGSIKPTNPTNPTKPSPANPVVPPSNPTPTPPPVSSGVTIKLNSNGVVQTINLEEYVIGVVAAEMPASFQSEALKAQAVAARTFAMKKKAAGITLLNSTTHQVYKTTDQMKSMWGSSYTTYYNKIKAAVEATKGKVLKYNGTYIDALYHAISNTKTELPKYVWGSNFGYLQSVSSNWDRNVKGFEATKTFSYSQISSKLGMTITKNTAFTINSKTVSNRVDSMTIGTKTYSGVTLRTKLGLRSTDFTVTKTDSGIIFTTRGYGHGVGMSQYGANEAAKEGYSYQKILNHYYTGVTITNI